METRFCTRVLPLLCRVRGLLFKDDSFEFSNTNGNPSHELKMLLRAPGASQLAGRGLGSPLWEPLGFLES